MKYTSLHNTKSIRFRRWSRAGYAVFCSLGSNVTIGRLVISISEKSLEKTGAISSSVAFTSTSTSTSEDEANDNEFSDIEAVLQIAQLEKLSESTMDIAAACVRVKLYKFNR